jgi:hypothetical protein
LAPKALFFKEVISCRLCCKIWIEWHPEPLFRV